MEGLLSKGMNYQKQVMEHVYENMENCEKLAKTMEVLNWRWADASAPNGIPNAMEIHEAIIELFEDTELYILGKPAEVLMKWDGSCTAKTGGLVLRWIWNTKTFELYDFEIMFDLWDYMI